MKKILIILILIFFFNTNLTVEAVNNSSYILLDCSSGRVLYEKNKDTRFLTASIAKIMTSIVAIEHGNLFDRYIVDAYVILCLQIGASLPPSLRKPEGGV